MNTLKAKILGLIAIIVIVIVTAASLINIQLQKKIKAIAKQNAVMTSETIKQSIFNSMHSGRAEELQNILTGIKSQESIKALRICDPAGKIIASADRGEIGRMAGAGELNPLIIGAFTHQDIPLDDKNALDTISIFHNSKECYGCHDASKDVLGILEVNMGMDHLQSLFSNVRNLSIFAATLIIFLLIMTISLFLFHYINKPINQLIYAMQQVEDGDFASAQVVASSDEMRLLFEKHNRMVGQLKEQINTTVNHERALARAQEKLAHQQEIQLMNRKLEDQLREIENLNVNLEERIEEIEEANYKIADLAKNLEDKNTTLEKIYMNTIHALVSATEANDSYTRGHSERVTFYSMALARKLKLSPERLEIVERAAILHDIGKIGIDLTLLHKEGNLTPEEVCDLRQHPVIGMNILEPIEFLQDVRICIGQHHERYDGLGYPNNVKAGELLLESRILAIADAFDAMTSDRPYRKPLPDRMAVKELINEAGSQFDPELVQHFVELVGNGVISSQQMHALRHGGALAAAIGTPA
ncbi:MAG TPA: HD domain-containing phosphohydrolase [Geobacteraceae bacterium]|nr:HD domain-containing phosphohydrolase [Geobacteraceae bacterium]